MSDEKMREAFHQYAEARGWDIEHCEGMYRSFETQIQWMGWKAAYAAGMERAEWICRLRAESCRRAESPIGAWHSDVCADAIRTDLPGANL